MSVCVVHGCAPGGYYRVDFWGEIDLFAAPDVRAALHGLANSECRDVLLEVSRLTFLDVVGARLLGEFLEVTRSRGGRLTVRAPTRQVARILEVTELAEKVDVERSGQPGRWLPVQVGPEDWRSSLN